MPAGSPLFRAVPKVAPARFHVDSQCFLKKVIQKCSRMRRCARVACAPDPESTSEVTSKRQSFNFFCIPDPLGPKGGPKGSLGGLHGACRLCASFGRSFGVPLHFCWHPFGRLLCPLLILGWLLGALCISWMLLGSSLEILFCLWASPCVFFVFVVGLPFPICIDICIILLPG